MIRKRLRRGLRALAGPTLFDATAQFGRLPAWTDLQSEAQNSRCIFIEPHFDDVVFSCGGLLAALARTGTQVELVTVFTDGPDPDTPLSPLARQLHDEWATESAPYENRRREAQAVTDSLEVTSYWLGLREALYRKPDLTCIEDILQPNTVPPDNAYLQKVAGALKELLETTSSNYPEPTTLFAPLGVGGHLDHLLVHSAVRALTTTESDVKTWYYEDFPYALDIEALKERVRHFKGEGRPATVDISATVNKRIELSGTYDSQVKAIFQSHEQMQENILNYASFVGTPSHPRERFWSG